MAQVLVAMSKIVFKLIALVLEGVKCLILNVPSRSTCPCKGIYVILCNQQIGDPGEMGHLAFFIAYHAINKINQQIVVCIV